MYRLVAARLAWQIASTVRVYILATSKVMSEQVQTCVYLLFYVLATSKVILGQAQTSVYLFYVLATSKVISGADLCLFVVLRPSNM